MNDETHEENTTTADSFQASSRTAKIVQAAAPFLDADTVQTLDLVVKFTDIMDGIQTLRERGGLNLFNTPRNFANGTVSMTGLSDATNPARKAVAPINLEGLLRNVRPHCTKQEVGIIDNILNIFSMKRYMEMFQSMSSMMSTMNSTYETTNQESPGTYTEPMNHDYEESQSTTNPQPSSTNQPMFDMLSTMLSPEQKSAFETMKMMFDSGMFQPQQT